MRKVSIEYTRLFFFRKRENIDVPENWLELSESQFAICSKAVTNSIADDEFISRFYGLRLNLVKRFTQFEKFKLVECADFVANPKVMSNFFFFESVPGTDLYAPKAKLQNISFEHFMLFDTFFFDYIHNPTIYNLQKFVASIYLRKDEILTTIDFNKRVNYVAKNIDKFYLDAILLNYTFIRKWLSSVFSLLFEYKEVEPDNLKVKQKQLTLKSNNKPDWNAILDGFIGDDVLNEHKYREISCIRAFKTINRRIKDFRINGK